MSITITDTNFTYTVVSDVNKTLSISGVNATRYPAALANWGAFPPIPLIYAGTNTTYNGNGNSANAYKVTQIAVSAFENKTAFSNTALTPAFLTTNLTQIGNKAFQGVKLQGTLTIPENIVNIGSMSFYNCTLITNIVIGSLVNSDVISHLSDLTAVLNQEITDRKNADDPLHLLKAPINDAALTGTAVFPTASITNATISTANVGNATVGTAIIQNMNIASKLNVSDMTFSGSTTTTGQWDFAVQPKYNGNVIATENHVNSNVVSLAGNLGGTMSTFLQLTTAIDYDISFASTVINGDSILLSSLASENSIRQSDTTVLSSALSLAVSSLTVTNSSLITVLSTEVSVGGQTVTSLSSLTGTALASLGATDISLGSSVSAENTTRSTSMSALSSAFSLANDSLTVKDSSLSTGLSTEISVRGSAIDSLSQYISTSISSLKSADTTLSTGISAEISTCNNSVSVLSSGLSSAISSLTAVDASLSTALSAEISDGVYNLDSLSTLITNELALMSVGIQTMSSDFDAESTTLSNAITGLSTSLTTTTSTMTSANSSISTAISVEASARTALASLETSASTAVSYRIGSNSTLSDAISTETLARVSQVQSVSAIVSATFPSLTVVVSGLSTSLSNEMSAATNALNVALSNVIGNAPSSLDTLAEIANQLNTNPSLTQIASIMANITNMSNAVSTEATSRTGAIPSVKSELSAAVSSLVVADSSISVILSTEVSDCGSAISSVSVSLANTKSVFTSINVPLYTALSTEISTRAASVTAVDSGLRSASNSLAAADTSLNTAISAETVNRLVSLNSFSTSLSTANSSLTSVNNLMSTNILAENGVRTVAISSVSTVLSTSVSAMQSAINANTGFLSTATSDAALKTTPSYLNAQISTVIGGAPSVLDTLAEIGAALNNQNNLAGSITTALATKVLVSYVTTLSTDLSQKANQTEYASLSVVVINKADTSAANTTIVNASILNNAIAGLIPEMSALKVFGGQVNTDNTEVNGVSLFYDSTATNSLYTRMGLVNGNGTINDKIIPLINPSIVSSSLGFEYNASNVVTKVTHFTTVNFDKDQSSVTVTGGAGNPTVAVNNMVLDASKNYSFTTVYTGDISYYAANKTSVNVTSLASTYRLAPVVPTLVIPAPNETRSIYNYAIPTVVTPYVATTWNPATQIITQTITINTTVPNVTLKFGLGGYTTSNVTIQAVSNAYAVGGQTNWFTITGGTSATFNVNYLRSLVGTGSNSISVNVIGTSLKLPSPSLTISNVINDIRQYAAPTVIFPNDYIYSGLYTGTNVFNMESGVTALTLLNSADMSALPAGVTFVNTMLGPNDMAVRITITEATSPLNFVVVAASDTNGRQSAASIVQTLVKKYAAPVLSSGPTYNVVSAGSYTVDLSYTLSSYANDVRVFNSDLSALPAGATFTLNNVSGITASLRIAFTDAVSPLNIVVVTQANSYGRKSDASVAQLLLKQYAVPIISGSITYSGNTATMLYTVPLGVTALNVFKSNLLALPAGATIVTNTVSGSGTTATLVISFTDTVSPLDFVVASQGNSNGRQSDASAVVQTLMKQYAAPVISGSLIFTVVSAGSYTTTMSYTVQSGVTAVSVLKSSDLSALPAGASVTLNYVSDTTASLVIEYTDAVLPLNVVVVAQGNDNGRQSVASAAQLLSKKYAAPVMSGSIAYSDTGASIAYTVDSGVTEVYMMKSSDVANIYSISNPTIGQTLSNFPTLGAKKTWTFTISTTLGYCSLTKSSDATKLPLFIDFRSDRVVLSQFNGVGWGPETHVMSGLHNLPRPTTFSVAFDANNFLISYNNTQFTTYANQQGIPSIYGINDVPNLGDGMSYSGPVVKQFPKWEMRIAFKTTGLNNQWRALIGDIRNAVNSRGWGLWLSSSNTLYFSWNSPVWDTLLTVSQNVDYIVAITRTSGSLTIALTNLSTTTNTTQTATNTSMSSYIMSANGPVTVGGWINDSSENFVGTISSVIVNPFIAYAVMSGTTATVSVANTDLTLDAVAIARGNSNGRQSDASTVQTLIKQYAAPVTSGSPIYTVASAGSYTTTMSYTVLSGAAVSVFKSDLSELPAGASVTINYVSDTTVSLVITCTVAVAPFYIVVTTQGNANGRQSIASAAQRVSKKYAAPVMSGSIAYSDTGASIAYTVDSGVTEVYVTKSSDVANIYSISNPTIGQTLSNFPTLGAKKTWTFTINTTLGSCSLANSSDATNLPLHILFDSGGVYLRYYSGGWATVHTISDLHNLQRPTTFSVSFDGNSFLIGYNNNTRFKLYPNYQKITFDGINDVPNLDGMTYTGPVVKQFPNWEMCVAFKTTGRNNQSTLLIGDDRNPITIQTGWGTGWGLGLSSSNTIYFAWNNPYIWDTLLLVSQNVEYIVAITSAPGSLTIALTDLSNNTTQTATKTSIPSSYVIAANGPVTLGGWINAPDQNFVGTISSVIVNPFIASAVVSGTTATVSVANADLTLDVGLVAIAKGNYNGQQSAASSQALIQSYAAPTISGNPSYVRVSASSYTATMSYTVSSGVTAVSVLQSNLSALPAGATVTTNAVSGTTASLVIAFTDAVLPLNIVVVAQGNSSGRQSVASVVQNLLAPIPLGDITYTTVSAGSYTASMTYTVLSEIYAVNVRRSDLSALPAGASVVSSSISGTTASLVISLTDAALPLNIVAVAQLNSTGTQSGASSIQLLKKYAAPVISGSPIYTTMGPGSYRANMSFVVESGVTALNVLQSNLSALPAGASVVSSSVSGTTASLVISYTDAVSPLNIVVVNATGIQNASAVQTLIKQFAAPVISGSLNYTGSNTATMSYTVQSGVTALNVLQSNLSALPSGATVTTNTVSGTTATLVISFTDAVSPLGIVVVAQGNSNGQQSSASVTQTLLKKYQTPQLDPQMPPPSFDSIGYPLYSADLYYRIQPATSGASGVIVFQSDMSPLPYGARVNWSFIFGSYTFYQTTSVNIQYTNAISIAVVVPGDSNGRMSDPSYLNLPIV